MGSSVPKTDTILIDLAVESDEELKEDEEEGEQIEEDVKEGEQIEEDEYEIPIELETKISKCEDMLKQIQEKINEFNSSAEDVDEKFDKRLFMLEKMEKKYSTALSIFRNLQSRVWDIHCGSNATASDDKEKEKSMFAVKLPKIKRGHVPSAYPVERSRVVPVLNSYLRKNESLDPPNSTEVMEIIKHVLPISGGDKQAKGEAKTMAESLTKELISEINEINRKKRFKQFSKFWIEEAASLLDPASSDSALKIHLSTNENEKTMLDEVFNKFGDIDMEKQDHLNDRGTKDVKDGNGQEEDCQVQAIQPAQNISSSDCDNCDCEDEFNSNDTWPIIQRGEYQTIDDDDDDVMIIGTSSGNNIAHRYRKN